MDFKSFVLDPGKVRSVLKKTGDKKVVTERLLKVYFPVRFEEHHLADVGADVHAAGLCAYVVDDTFYARTNFNAMAQWTPDAINKVVVDEEDYYEMVFYPGSVVMKSLMLVKRDTLVYYIFDELIAKVRIPEYYNYEDMGHIFDTAGKHAGAPIGNNPEEIELIISVIARDPNDRKRYWREACARYTDLSKYRPAWISLRSVQYAATNTTNKLVGARFGDGLVSAMVDPSDRVEYIESILRE